MIRLRHAVIVEGKYDKITLENVIDATIITTDGFGIFKNKEKCELIKTLARRYGIIVLTDSDSAGAFIRSHLKQICPADSITNVYVPQLLGKEKRKTHASKQGLLGVEGMKRSVLEEAFRRSGVLVEQSPEDRRRVTKGDFFDLGLSGAKNSSGLRDSLAGYLGLPTGISANALLDAVNAVYSYEEFSEAIEKWLPEMDKR